MVVLMDFGGLVTRRGLRQRPFCRRLDRLFSLSGSFGRGSLCSALRLCCNVKGVEMSSGFFVCQDHNERQVLVGGLELILGVLRALIRAPMRLKNEVPIVRPSEYRSMSLLGAQQPRKC